MPYNLKGGKNLDLEVIKCDQIQSDLQDIKAKCHKWENQKEVLNIFCSVWIWEKVANKIKYFLLFG